MSEHPNGVRRILVGELGVLPDDIRRLSLIYLATLRRRLL